MFYLCFRLQISAAIRFYLTESENASCICGTLSRFQDSVKKTDLPNKDGIEIVETKSVSSLTFDELLPVCASRHTGNTSIGRLYKTLFLFTKKKNKWLIK